MNRIKDMRKSVGIKQVDLSTRIGVSQGALSGWENGKYEPDTAAWIKLSHVFNVSVDYLMGIEDEIVKPPDTSLLPDESLLLSSYRALSQQGKEYIMQTMAMAAQIYIKSNGSSDMETNIG